MSIGSCDPKMGPGFYSARFVSMTDLGIAAAKLVCIISILML
jgi:hypothetical protein